MMEVIIFPSVFRTVDYSPAASGLKGFLKVALRFELISVNPYALGISDGVEHLP